MKLFEISLVLFFNIYVLIDETEAKTCTRNIDIISEIPYIEDSSQNTLCVNDVCSYKYLELNKDYTGCTKKGVNKLENLTVFLTNFISEDLLCLDRGAWQLRCFDNRTNMFAPYPNITTSLFYTVLCENFKFWMPSKDRLNVFSLEYEKHVAENFELKNYFAPGVIFTCTSFCSQDIVELSVPIPNDNYTFPFFMDDITNSYLMATTTKIPINYSCLSSGQEFVYEIYVNDPNVYKTQILTTGKPINKLGFSGILHVNDGISCNCSHKVGLKPVEYKGQGCTLVVQGYSPESPNQFVLLGYTIEKHFILRSGFYRNVRVHCFIGAYNNSYYLNKAQSHITEYQIYDAVGSFDINVIYGDGKPVIDADVENKRWIKCIPKLPPKTYDENIVENIITGYFYKYQSQKFETLDDLININFKYSDHGSPIFFERTDLKDQQMFIICKSPTKPPYYSKVLRIYSNDRPRVRFVQYFPHYKTRYALRGYVYTCHGSFAESVDIKCYNCSEKSTNFPTFRKSNLVMYLYLPNNLNENLYMTFMCIGISNEYEKVYDYIHLNIRYDAVAGILDMHDFLMVGDVISCAYSIKDRNNTVYYQRSPMTLRINDVIQNGYENIRIISGDNFEYCCYTLAIKTHDHVCEWRSLPVAEIFTVNFVNTEMLYPLAVARCFICLYTNKLEFIKRKDDVCRRYNEQYHMRITMTRKVPDGRVFGDVCISGKDKMVRIPKDTPTIPNSDRKYGVTDIVTNLYCCYRNTYTLKRVELKSCVEQPPEVHLLPRHKVLLLVNETLSCYTSHIACMMALDFHLKLTIPGVKIVTRPNSYIITGKDSGEIIHASCVTGDPPQAMAGRYITILSAPYNITISHMSPKLILPSTVEVGDHLKCTAEGYPHPEITWNQLKGVAKLKISTNNLLVTTHDDSGYYEVVCVAQNPLGRKLSTRNFTIENPNLPAYISDPNSYFYTIVLVIIVLYFILFLFAFALVFQEEILGSPFTSPNAALPLYIEIKLKDLPVQRPHNDNRKPHLQPLSRNKPSSNINKNKKSDAMTF